MELKQLYYFRQICICRSISAAAESLFITQQALSRSLSQLEKELNTELITRNTRHMELTEAGKSLLVRTNRIIQEVEAISSDLKAVASSGQKKWNIGCSDCMVGPTGGIMTVEDIRKVQKEIQGVNLKIHEAYNDVCAEDLKKGKLDGAILIDPLDFHLYDYVILDEAKVYIIVPKEHRLAGKQKAVLADLVGETFFLPYRTERIPQMLKYIFYRNSLPVPDETMLLSPCCSLFSMMNYVYANEGITFLADFTLEVLDREKCAVLDTDEPLLMPVRFCYPKNHQDAVMLARLGNEMQEMIRRKKEQISK